MAKDKKKAKSGKKAASAAKATERPENAQHPSDGELRFQHVIRNMVVARDGARRSGGRP